MRCSPQKFGCELRNSDKLANSVEAPWTAGELPCEDHTERSLAWSRDAVRAALASTSTSAERHDLH